MASPPSILLADDEPLQRGSLGLMLQQEGYDVTTVEDGLAALIQLEKKQFDIVLTDIRMPRMTGMELLKQIKERNIKSEVILITGCSEVEDAAEATRMGAYNFVEKNQNMDERLKSMIKQATRSKWT